MSKPSALEIATEQLYELYDRLGPAPTDDERVRLGALAAQVEIARRLEGIERSLDLGISVRTE